MLAYIHIQKTAGQTIRSILMRNFGTRHCDLPVNYSRINSRVIAWINRCYPELVALSGHAVVPGGILDMCKEAKVFTVLREPVARATSHYQFSNRRLSEPEPLVEWVNKNKNRQVRTLAGEENLDKAIEFIETRVGFVGLTEQFDESLILLQKWVNLKNFNIDYVPLNVASNNRVRDKIISSRSQFALIEESNQLDTQLYNYVRKKIYPRQRIEFGPELEDATAYFQRSLPDTESLSLNFICGRVKRNFLFRPRFSRLLS